MQNYIAPGDVLTVVATAPTVSGAAVLVGDLLGVPTTSGNTGDTVSVIVEGVFSIKKKAATAVAQGVKLYWDAANNQIDITDNAAANKWVGWAYSPATAASSVVSVRLMG